MGVVVGLVALRGRSSALSGEAFSFVNWVDSESSPSEVLFFLDLGAGFGLED
jgi:hypothetical protein